MSVSQALTRAIVRLSAPGGYCSGALVAPDLVLTCAHFFRGTPTYSVRLLIDGSVHHAAAVTPVSGTDVAVVRLNYPVDVPPLPIGRRPAVGAPTVTLGYGGHANAPAARPGRYLGTIPVALSRGMATVVRPAGLMFCNPPAVHGDSGGPVLVRGRVVGVQSLILDPFGRNLRVATVSLVPESVRSRVRRA